jgi:hypothetical protein
LDLRARERVIAACVRVEPDTPVRARQDLHA